MDHKPAAWTFSTLGCPELDLAGICELANRWGINVLELRCVSGRIDLPACFEEEFGTPDRVAQVLTAHGQRIRLLDTSFQLMSDNPDQREEFLRFVPWAEALQVPYLRVFDGGVLGEGLTPAKAAQAAVSVRWWQELRRRSGWQVDIVMETHTTCRSSADCLAIEGQLDEPMSILWDTHGTWGYGESIAETWRALSPFVRHMHVKDKINDSTAPHGHRHALPGEGEFPWDELLAAWREVPYEGTVSLEWERKWAPELPPLEVALAAARKAHWF